MDDSIHSQNTNAYGSVKMEAKGKKWTPVTEKDIIRFFGIMLYLGLNQKHGSMRELWSNNKLIRNQFVAESMSRDRFLNIFYNIHCEGDTDEQQNDRLKKVRKLQMKLAHQCKKQWNPHEHVAVDEAMVAYKGRLSWRQYIPSKPKKYGMKIWVLADEKGYCIAYRVYTGNETPANCPITLSKSSAVV
eukprot:TRINITY_DN31121_c0_g3_i1.p1 TRINITY_DN31121_c0_g3~~TRINITY_DN31121_c0_g3_i1.p1  ORF type:complete len:188 (+),score=34.15 TRINITY_DN31121_c0_g3_i1:335-898(+)